MKNIETVPVFLDLGHANKELELSLGRKIFGNIALDATKKERAKNLKDKRMRTI